MSCNRFEKYERGKLKGDVFQAHAKGCSTCRETADLDEELLQLSKSLKERQVNAPYLWTKIERQMKEVRPASQKTGWAVPFLSGRKVYSVCLVFLIVLCAGLVFWLMPSLGDHSLLTTSTLRRIEKREKRYERSIEKLQKRVLPQLPDLGLEWMLLYRDRMETIDEQILACKEALQTNPGNSHIRRYMLAAFQDKKKSLKEIMGIRSRLRQEENFE